MTDLHFYDRTAYKFLDSPVPSCFVRLDQRFSQHEDESYTATIHMLLLLTEGLCARMADVEMYIDHVEDARQRYHIDMAVLHDDDLHKAAILTRTYTIGLLGACRSLLDSGALTLAELYRLPISNPECRFDNPHFWELLTTHAPDVYRRYHTLRFFFNEIIHWQSSIPHRLPPLAVLQDRLGPWSSREMQVKLADDDKADLVEMATEPLRFQWSDALDVYGRWKPQLLTLCERVCQDIESHFP